MATHEIDLAYAWADEACLLDRVKLIRKFPVDEFPQKAGMLKQYGLGVPQIALIHPLLVARDLFSAGAIVPRSCAELASLLER